MNLNLVLNSAKGEFSDIAEIRDIVASANMGIWRIDLVEDTVVEFSAREDVKEIEK